MNKNWNEPVDGTIYIPDELDEIVNKVGMQINFMQYSGKSIEQTICDIVKICQEYFTNLPKQPTIEEDGEECNFHGPFTFEEGGVIYCTHCKKEI